MNKHLFSHTPTVAVFDNRGLSIRGIEQYRHPDTLDRTDVRISHQAFDPRGFLVRSADARLHQSGCVNFRYLTTLAGGPLRTQGADNGTSIVVSDAAGRPLMSVSGLQTTDDGVENPDQAVIQTWHYQTANQAGRPFALAEQRVGGIPQVTERFIYAGCHGAEKSLNVSGACIRHYDTAGLLQINSVALTGVPLSVSRCLLKTADNPDAFVDWQGEDEAVWETGLATETHIGLASADATSSMLTTTDAKGNVQRATYDVAGRLAGSWLTISGNAQQVIVKTLVYSAAGQTLHEVHGNGVVTTYDYDLRTQSRTGIRTERPTDHAAGARVLQNLRYEYDPVGNVLRAHNDAEKIRFWRNQSVEPESTYTYDSLYQLVSATGREMAANGLQRSSLPTVTQFDRATYTRYKRTYTYDRAGNLTRIGHYASATENSYTVNITVSDRSNRGVLNSLTQKPEHVDAFFTASGQQTRLQPGQALSWTLRNELLKVSPVTVEGAADDSESYRYDASGQRILKVNIQSTGAARRTRRVVYLPNLELRTTTIGATETEDLQVVTAHDTGSAQVRVLCWRQGAPDGLSNNQVRFSYGDLIGSASLEVDGRGQVISMEEYFSYGGTAVLVARNQTEADYKTLRYSGQERDATGLYYYGYRYYQPWAGRWLSADPQGAVDGLNLFRMVVNNPIVHVDESGLMGLDIRALFRRTSEEEKTAKKANKSYARMIKGVMWKNRINSEQSVKELSGENLEALRKVNYPLTREAHELIERMKNLNFNIIHFSSSDMSVDKDVLYSAKKFFGASLGFSAGNTTYSDITKLATEDFVFFSLGVGGFSGKETSRFGGYRYQAPLQRVWTEKYVKHAHLTVNDTLQFSKRQTSNDRLAQVFDKDDVETLRRELIAKKAVETVFHINDIHEGLALRIVNSTKQLSENGQGIVHQSQTDADFDKIISLFYRPQLLIPRKIALRHMTKSSQHGSAGRLAA